jgi:hypothetical protein
MKQVGVDAEICRMRTCSAYCDAYLRKHMVSVEIQVRSNDVFRTKIGFRHSVEKSLLLEIACSYENYCVQVMKQHDAAMTVVNESMKEIRSIPIALSKVRGLYEHEKALNEYYSYLTTTLIRNRRKSGRSSAIRTFDYSFMETALEYI